MPAVLILLLMSSASFGGTSAARVGLAKDDKLARATRDVTNACPAMPRRLVELFGIMAEGAGVGLIALYESPFALFDYLVVGPKTAPADHHPYFPSTESHAADVRLRYRSLLEGIESPECLHAVCEVERLKSPDGRAVSAACGDR